MTILFETAALQETIPGTPADTIYTEVPTLEPTPLERVMLPDDKIFVVLAVVMVIWIGILFLLFRTDHKIKNVERELDENITGSRGA